MGARGTGLKKDTHTDTSTASSRGERTYTEEDSATYSFSYMLYTLAGGGTLCGVATLILLLVSTATDFWMQYRYSGSFAHQDLSASTTNERSMRDQCHGSLSHANQSFWDATRAFMLLAVLSCLAGVLLGLSAFANGAKTRRLRTGGIALVLSGFLALFALSIYARVTVTFFGKQFTDWPFSWSYIIGWVAIILAFAAGVFQLWAYQRTTAEPAAGNIPDS